MLVHRAISTLMGTLLVGTAGAGPPVAARDSVDTAPVTATPVTARLHLVADDAEPVTLEIPGRVTPRGLRFEGVHRDPARSLTVRWDWLADLDPRGRARIEGLATLTNHARDKREFDLRLSMPTDPLIDEASRIGGKVRVALVMDENGGRVDAVPGSGLWSVLVDDRVARTLHRSPFAMGGADAGTSVADANFGAPYPAVAAPAVADGFGLRLHFRLTGGDEARFESAVVLDGDPEHLRARPVAGPIRIGAVPARGPISIDLGGGARSGGRRGRGGGSLRRELVITPARGRDRRP